MDVFAPKASRQCKGPEDVYFLISKIYEYTILHGKKDIVDVTEVKDPEAERLSWSI